MDADRMRELVSGARGGDSGSWNELVRMFQRRVFAAAVALIGNAEEADEIAQEVFVRLYSNIGNIKDGAAVGSWLVRTSVNLARDRMRFRRLRGWLFAKRVNADEIELMGSDGMDPERARALSEVTNLWKRAKLSEKERAVVQLKLGEEMTYSEISRALKMSISTAKTHYTRGIEKLRSLSRKGGGSI